jgi:predicted phage baseplate assembly protein
MPWPIHRDLLNSKGYEQHAVVELDNEGIASLRFGDDESGARPDSGTEFNVTYRVGNGPEGNVGTEAIKHLVSLDDRVVAVRNPLPAQGGLAAEKAAQIRRRAPQAFRTQLRAVTSEDYANFTAAHPGIQQAAATPRWTGSWHTQTITVDRNGGVPLDAKFETQLATGLERYRMAGHDLNFNDPVFVSLQLELQVCVSRDYFRSDVEQALLEIFNNQVHSDGSLGLFHPDNFSFGQTIYLSPYYAHARQIRGVTSVQIIRFSRQGDEDQKPLSDGYMNLGKLEIARLDNNPNFPEHGVLKLIMLGGK